MRERQAVRLLVVDGRDRILLFEIEDATVYDPKQASEAHRQRFWITVGGGIEAGEDDRAAGLRELWEETGITLDELGPCVWTHDHVLMWGGAPLRLTERYYLVRVPTGDIILDNEVNMREVYRAHRWWSADELAASEALIFPDALRTDLAPLLAGAIPDRPIRID